MSCNYCDIDAIHRKHLPLICRKCPSKLFQFISKCECLEPCTHAAVPVCIVGHVNRPILTKTCKYAMSSDLFARELIDKQKTNNKKPEVT
jgi:hypothetical protein